MKIQIHSLGFQTDLIFPSFEGVVLEQPGYLVVRTPSNPGFYWGNFLLFRQPPQAGDELRWPSLFAEEIGKPPQYRHQTFGWDSGDENPGAVQGFLDLGYHLERSSVLAASPEQLQPPSHPAPGVTIRPLNLEDPAELERVIELQMATREPEFSEAPYLLFRQRQMERYRKMNAAGLGAWFGAYAGSALVADLGIYHNHSLGRFQHVETHPAFRRQGIAGRLVYQASQYALEHFPIQRLVIVAQADSDAARLYQSVGYSFVEYEWGLEKWTGE